MSNFANRRDATLKTLVKAQIVFLLSTLTEDRYARNQAEIRSLAEQHGLEVYLHFIRRLIVASPQSNVFFDTSSALTFQLLVQETQRLARDPFLADRFRDAIDKGEGDVFRHFDLTKFCERVGLRPLECLVLASSIVSTPTTRHELASQAVQLILSNFDEAVVSIRKTPSFDHEDLTSLHLAELLSRLLSAPPSILNAQQRIAIIASIGNKINSESMGPIRQNISPTLSLSPETSLKRDLATETPDLTGQISRYGSEPLARGGYSTVWRGIWRPGQSMEYMVVIKILTVWRAPRNQDIQMKLAKRLDREMKVWVNLNHPNVVPLLGHSAEPEGPALISPFYGGGCVTDYLTANPSVDRNLICADVAAGLSYLHSCDPPIIHGDIKGTNILVNENGNAALCDFGLSLTLDGRPTGYTSSDFGGSLRFLAPELLDGDVRTTATDIYALGCTCMQILFSKLPYEGVMTEAHIIRAIVAREPPFQLQEEQVIKLRFHPSILQRTWGTTPSQRPAAQDIAAVVQRSLGQDFNAILLDSEITGIS